MESPRCRDVFAPRQRHHIGEQLILATKKRRVESGVSATSVSFLAGRNRCLQRRLRRRRIAFGRRFAGWLGDRRLAQRRLFHRRLRCSRRRLGRRHLSNGLPRKFETVVQGRHGGSFGGVEATLTGGSSMDGEGNVQTASCGT
jgi:hypothetical protein